MEFLKSFTPSWMNFNISMIIGVGIGLALLAALYFGYRRFMGSKSPFSDMGEGCDPQIENACGKDANCHPDETGEKGICFPKEEEHAHQEAPQQEESMENLDS